MYHVVPAKNLPLLSGSPYALAWVHTDLLVGAMSRITVCVVCLQLLCHSKSHENTLRGCSALFACHRKCGWHIVKQGKVCFSVSGNTHHDKAVEPCWFPPQNCCSVNLVSVHIPALSTLQFTASACHIALCCLTQVTQTNTSYWTKTLITLSVSPQLIRRLPGWLDVQSMWPEKHSKKKKINKRKPQQVCSPSPFISTHCLHWLSQMQSVPSSFPRFS